MSRVWTTPAALLLSLMTVLPVMASQGAPGSLQQPTTQGSASPRGPRNSVHLGESYVLRAGEAADDAVVIFGSADVAGEVLGDLVVISGGARLAGTAAINGDVVVIGGSVTIQPGASVAGDFVLLGGALDAPETFSPGGDHVVLGSSRLGRSFEAFGPWLTRGLLWGRLIVPDLAWVWGVVAFFSLLYLLVNLVFDRTVRASSDVLGETPLTAFGVGVLVVMLIGPASLVLAISVIGLAVIPVLNAALVGAGLLGKAAVARRLGRNVLEEPPGARLLAARSVVIGLAILCVAYMVPILGVVAWAISGVLGLGAVTVVALSAFRREHPPASLVPSTPAGSSPPAAEPGPRLPQSAAMAPEPEASAPKGLHSPDAASDLALLAFPLAGFRDRLAAFVLDILLVALATGVFGLGGGRWFLLALLAYHVALWTWKQSTIGGIICNLRIVRVDGVRLTFPDALVRGLSSIFSLVALGLGGLWILRDPHRQAWHDRIAGTYVVKVPAARHARA
jgi:uncharacterized RDD family membrane protein YckC